MTWTNRSSCQPNPPTCASNPATIHLRDFNGERIPFLDRDLTLLPIRNVTVEELAHYLLDTLRRREEIQALDVQHMVLKCASGEGQWASAQWS